MKSMIAAVVIGCLSLVRVESAGETVRFDHEAAWLEAVGPGSASIPFTEYPHGTWLSDQYLPEYGIEFGSFVQVMETKGFPLDGFGIRGWFAIGIEIHGCANAIGALHTSGVDYTLYNQDGEYIDHQIFYALSELSFGGLVVDESVRFVVIRGLAGGSAFIDTLFIGPRDCPCPADLDESSIVDQLDLMMLLEAWGQPGGDVDGDQTTDVRDLLELLASWGEC